MKTSERFLLPLAAIALCGGAFAQGDDCSTATVITGSTTMDTTVLTESDFEVTAGCQIPFTNTFANDGFFQITLTPGVWDIDTVGTTWDTQLALYEGVGCAATCLARDDDSAPGGTGLQSRIIVTVTASQSILIQVGGFDAAANGMGNLNINPFVQDPSCVGVPADALEDNDTCVSAPTLTPGTYTGLNVDAGDADFYSFTLPAGDILTVTETFDSNDTDYRLFDACTGFILVPASLPGVTYNNVSGAPMTVVMEAHQWLGAVPLCSDYDFDVTIAPDPCLTAVDDSFEDNDDCATAAPIGDGVYNGLFVSALDIDNYSFTVPNGGTLMVDAFHVAAVADVDLFLWLVGDPNCGTAAFGTTELASGFTGLDNENLTYTNMSGADQAVILEVSLFNGDCNNYDMTISGAGMAGFGTPFCDPANNNSTGFPTVLTGDMTAPGGSGLHLEANQGPSGQFGYYLVGTGFSEPGIMLPMSAGRLCLALGGGNSIGRYNVTGTQFNSLGSFDASGIHQNLVGTSSAGSGFDVPTTVPISGSPTIMLGSTWHFQLWHRENAGSSNFSNGLSVMF